MGQMGASKPIDLTAARANAAAGYPTFDAAAANAYWGNSQGNYIDLTDVPYVTGYQSQDPAPSYSRVPYGPPAPQVQEAGLSGTAIALLIGLGLIVLPNLFASR